MTFSIKKWVAALRDPNNKQAKGVLMDATGAMCCLGLALKVEGVDQPQSIFRGRHYQFCGAWAMPTNDQIERLGLSRPLARALAIANDANITFAQIADFLETGDETLLLTVVGGECQRALIDYQPS